MKSYLPLHFGFLAALSLLLCLGLTTWWIFGNPPREIVGYIQINLFGPPIPFYGDPELFGVPFWLLITTSAIPPSLWAARKTYDQVLSRRARIGFCHKCGYDLRATPSRCPECGVVPKEIPISAG